MTDNSKKVVILTPVWVTEVNGRESTLIRAYKSIVNQDYTNWVWLIIDDGSPVNLNRFRNIAKPDISSNRIIIIRREKSEGEYGSASQARNYGLNHIIQNESKSEFSNLGYLVYLDSDDELLDISKRVELFNRRKNTVIVTASIERIHYNGKSNTIHVQKGLKDDTNVRRIWRQVYLKGFPNVTTMWKWNFLKELIEFKQIQHPGIGFFDSDIIYGEDRCATWTAFKYILSNNYAVVNDPSIICYRYHWQEDSESIAVDLDPKKIKRLKQDHKLIAKRYLSLIERIDKLIYKKLIRNFG